jgi:hypothetical protein
VRTSNPAICEWEWRYEIAHVHNMFITRSTPNWEYATRTEEVQRCSILCEFQLFEIAIVLYKILIKSHTLRNVCNNDNPKKIGLEKWCNKYNNLIKMKLLINKISCYATGGHAVA